MPTPPKYLDFDVAIQRNGEQFRVRVLNSPGGQADAVFVLPFNADRLENLILRMGHTRVKARGSNSKQMQAAKELGGGLYRALLTDTVARCWEKSLTIAAERRMGLRVRLRLNDAPELADLPWEYLYDDSTLNRFYHLSKETPLVRYLELADPPGALTITPPLNILLIVSSPRDDDYVPLDAAKEERLLREALADLEQRRLVTITRLAKPTLNALQRELRTTDYHILHFIGHGVFDLNGGRGFLVWEDDQRAAVRVDGEMFARMIEDSPLRLVVLNACEGARPTLNDPFGGFAQRVIQQGIPAVIAMQFEITDQAAITFAREFYAALADNYPVDAALAEARKAIYALPNETEWGTPVLYSRAPDGMIFDVRGSPPPAAVQPPKKAQASFDDVFKQARSAQREAEQILEENPNDTATASEKFQLARDLFLRTAELKPDEPRVAFRLGQVLVQLEPHEPKAASEQFRRAERLLTDPSTDDEKKLLANIIYARAILTNPPNEKLLLRAGELADEVKDEVLLGRIEQVVQQLASSNPATDSVESFQPMNRVEPPPYADPNQQSTVPPPPFAYAPQDVTNPNWQPPDAGDFNPIGRWNVQVQDMVGSRLFVEFAPNGMFQMMQQVGMYQVPVNGSWGYNPLTHQLGLQGVVNTFQPFMLMITMNNAVTGGYAGVGNDGIGYVLTRA